MVTCITLLQILPLIIRSGNGQCKMPNPSALNLSEEKLSVVFVENPTASYKAQCGYDAMTFLTVSSIACPKMKQAFPHLVLQTEDGWVIHEWVSSMALCILL